MARTNGRSRPQRGPGRIRGLTKSRYQSIARLVRLGKTTWAELERRGIALPPGNESNFLRNVRRVLAGGGKA